MIGAALIFSQASQHCYPSNFQNIFVNVKDAHLA